MQSCQPSICKWYALLPVLLAALLPACSPDQPAQFAPDDYPDQLSAWGLMHVADERLQLHPAQVPYDLVTPLFSDYALKLRSIWVPPGTSVAYRDDTAFDFPIGTIISKTFYYARDPADPDTVRAGTEMTGFAVTAQGEAGLALQNARLIETRLLVRQTHGWDALPYVWDAVQQDARLSPGGAIERLSLDRGDGVVDFAYVVPNRNECAACHVIEQKSDQIQPLGPAARHLDRMFSHYPGGPAPQLQHWASEGLLTGLPEARQMRDSLADDAQRRPENLDLAARRYLDINCGHCHRPGGSADTSGLFLHAAASAPLTLGICKPPVAAGRGTGGRRYSIVPGKPEDSILLFRMQSRELDVRMPELGRTLPHAEGVALLTEWIGNLRGACAPDASGADDLEVVSNLHATFLEHDGR